MKARSWSVLAWVLLLPMPPLAADSRMAGAGPGDTCPASVREIDLLAFLVAREALSPESCLGPVGDGPLIQLISVDYGELDGEEGEEAVVRAQSCSMGTGGADISEVLRLVCRPESGTWDLERLEVEELPYDRGPGRRRYAPRLSIEEGRLRTRTSLYRDSASNVDPSWLRTVEYAWSGEGFVVERVEIEDLEVEGEEPE